MHSYSLIKSALGGLCFICWLLGFPSPARSQAPALLPSETIVGQAQIHRQFTVAPQGVLSLELPTGAQLVVQGGSTTLDLQADLSGKDVPVTGLEIAQKGDHIHLRTFFAHGQPAGEVALSLTLRLPSGWNLQLDCAKGSVRLAGLEGSLTGQLQQGDLFFSDLRGSLWFTCGKGNIEGRQSAVSGAVHTQQGTVSLTGVSPQLEASSLSGKVTHLPPVSNEPYQLSYPTGDVVLSHLPQGGVVSTGNGSLQLGRCEAPVQATAGGDLTVEQTNSDVLATAYGHLSLLSAGANVVATSYGGNQLIRLLGNASSSGRTISLSATDGDVTLWIPAAFSFDLVLEQDRRESNPQTYRLESDFTWETPSVLESRDGPSNQDALPLARRQKSGGKNTVVIRVTNGSVFLKKSH